MRGSQECFTFRNSFTCHSATVNPFATMVHRVAAKLLPGSTHISVSKDPLEFRFLKTYCVPSPAPSRVSATSHNPAFISLNYRIPALPFDAKFGEAQVESPDMPSLLFYDHYANVRV